MVGRVERSAEASPEARSIRHRNVQVARRRYRWSHLAGLPAFCEGLPEAEVPGFRDRQRFRWDLASSLVSAGASSLPWLANRTPHTPLRLYDRLYALRPKPSVAARWKLDEEFARQRLDGVNPMMLRRIDEIPAHLAVDDARARDTLGGRGRLAELLADGRVYLADWAALEGAPTALGRFLTAPMALFHVDDDRGLLPLAIQLGQSEATAPVVFTPNDDPWLWLTARTHVQSSDAAYHEVVLHLFRTHFVMETVWVATKRSLPPDHPVHELLTPHCVGTIGINDAARTELIVPGGPIDEAISVGTDGAYWLVEQEVDRFRFDDLDPIADLERRDVDDLPGYHYRDDVRRLWTAVGDYTGALLRCFYPDDAAVADDAELEAWAAELSGDDAGRLKGLPLVAGRFQTFDDLHRVVHLVLFTASCGHSAVNNGQWDQFGYLPNAPGAIFLPPPTTLDPSSEDEFSYGLGSFRAAATQLTLVHLLSMDPVNQLGDYPPGFFEGRRDVDRIVDRFRHRLDGIAIDIDERNRHLDVPYDYLAPSQIAASINT